MVEAQQLSHVQRNTNALLVISAAAIWLALFGPAWTYAPATATTPATALNFADLAALNAANPSGLQVAFYGWVAWTFAALTTAAVIIAFRSGKRLTGAACALIGGVQLLITVFVTVKAAPDMSVLFASLPNTRLGTVLFLGSMLALIFAGFQRLRGTRLDLEAGLLAA
ncbi:hypothetical protein ACWEOI_22350 [Nocardia sp. NPDC004340]